MNTQLRTAILAFAIAGLVACQGKAPGPATQSASGGTLEENVGENVSRAMAEARRKLETENLTLRSDDGETRKAEITPAGDLLIDGKSIPLDAAQRRLVLAHRQQILAIAEAGMGVGIQGAKLATRAMTEAISGIFSGNPDRIGKRVDAQAQDIKKAARALCDRLPAMYASQQTLAAAIPEFAPFAKTTPNEINDCKTDADGGHAPAAPEAPAAPSAPAPPSPSERSPEATA